MTPAPPGRKGLAQGGLGQHVVAVMEEIYVGQRCGGSQHDQGRLVVSHLLCQRNTNPINYRPTIHLLTCVQDGAAETGPRLLGCPVLILEESEEGCGEVDHPTGAERFQVHIGGSEGSQEVSFRVKSQR